MNKDHRLPTRLSDGVVEAAKLLTPSEDQGDGGWLENKVGKVYVSPLPDGIGNCTHLAMLDPCPTPPHCPTCPKLRANKRHCHTFFPFHPAQDCASELAFSYR